MYLRIRSQSFEDRAKLVRFSFCKFSQINREAHAIANQIVIILSFAATSIPLWPANLLQSLLRTGFASVLLSGFIAARLFFTIADANSTSNFVYDLLWRRHVQDLVAFLIPFLKKKNSCVCGLLKILLYVKHPRSLLNCQKNLKNLRAEK